MQAGLCRSSKQGAPALDACSAPRRQRTQCVAAGADQRGRPPCPASCKACRAERQGSVGATGAERQQDEGSSGRRGVGGTRAGRPLQRPRLSGTDLGGIIGCPETMTRGDWAPCWPLLWEEHVTAARRCFRATAGALGALLEAAQLLVLLRRQADCWRAAATATMLPMGSCRALRGLWLWQAVRGPLQAMSVAGAASRVDDNAAACSTQYLPSRVCLCAMHAATSCFYIALPHPQCIVGSTHGSKLPRSWLSEPSLPPHGPAPTADGVGRLGSAMEPLSQAALAKLARDLKDLQQNAIDGVKVGCLRAGWVVRWGPGGACGSGSGKEG